MKKYYLLSFLGIVLLGVFLACSDEEEVPPGTETVVPGTDHNILIAYFSEPIPDGVDANSSASRIVVDGELYGSVEYMAAVIGEATGGDMARIRTAQSYPGNYDDLAAQADEERQSDARPELSTVIENFDDYDVVFVGYPIWWYQMPMAMYTFFDTYDFAGKTIVPFSSHGGSGWSGTLGVITELEPDATLVTGRSVSRGGVAESEEGILQWLQDIGIVE